MAAEHPNKIAFEEGTSYIFHNWTALKLAVEQDWGGVESVEKREWFIDTIVDHFGKLGKKLDIEEVEDILYQIMTDEFNVTLEDDSPYLVAKHLVSLYEQCVKGDFKEVERLREKTKTQNTSSTSSCVKQQGEEDADSDNNDADYQKDANNV
ncbi:Pre-rRNA-processing protein TSR2-domain-containing protein [Parasitella parasitica]|nr:Pre-rRNA-processing protein TSR2-domain-containing protein [Parasitella parasitica]